MGDLTASALLDLWERAGTQRGACRFATLLAGTWPGPYLPDLTTFTAGAAQARLLQLRRQLFGTMVEGVTDCSACGTECELSFSLDQLAGIAGEDYGNSEEQHLFEWSGWVIRFRLPTVRNMLGCADLDAAAGRRMLLEQCVLSAYQHGTAYPPGELPDPVVAGVAERMARADPCGDVELRVVCPDCAHSWLVAFDVATFLWNDVESWAIRLLDDVQRLAAAYGWREPDVLALSSHRRHLYVDALPT